MTPEREATYLWAYEAIIAIIAFCFTGNWFFFCFGLFFLIMFYSFLEWEFEKEELEAKYPDALYFIKWRVIEEK